MMFKKFRELIFGVIMTAFGVFYLVMTTQIPRKGELVDATFIPYILSVFMICLGIAQLMQGMKIVKNFKDDGQEEQKNDHMAVILTLALIVGYVMIMVPVGFIISTIVYLFLQFWLLSPADKKPNLLMYLVIAVVVSIVIYLLFRYGLTVMLPKGIFGL